jgi:FG-GAP-like repeat
LAAAYANETVLTAQNQLSFADFNGDGSVDIVSWSGFSLAILLGHDDGTFADPILYETPGAVRSVADVDGDGQVDIVTSRGMYTSVLRGRCL